MRKEDHYYIEGMTLSDKLHFVSDKLGVICEHLDDIAYDLYRENLND
ncbi:MAG: hypothetical protein NTZ38_03765 [Candidatus Taylorbacteria bacterium]|nr:hypothetical protein [Candidatus Taylorbacteria bacterium]